MTVCRHKKFAVENQKGQRDVWWNPAINIMSLSEGFNGALEAMCRRLHKAVSSADRRDPASCFGLLLSTVMEGVSLLGRAL
jgi:hypothetical protein